MSSDTLQIILGFITAGIIPVIMAFLKAHSTSMEESRKLQSEQNDAMIVMASSISELRGEIAAIVKSYQSTIVDMQAISKALAITEIKIDGIKGSADDIHRRIDAIN